MLGLCTSELLAAKFPEADEGSLTRMRSALVNATALARFAKKVDLGPALALGRGARTSGEREGLNVLADAVEALVAAVYDGLGIDAARKLSAAIVEDPLGELGREPTLDPKSELQERVQARGEPAADVSRGEDRGPGARSDDSSSRSSSASASSRRAKARARKRRSAQPRARRSHWTAPMSAEWILQSFAYDEKRLAAFVGGEKGGACAA